VVVAIDRIGRNARSVSGGLRGAGEVGQVSLISLREGFDFSTPTGKMMLTMVAASQRWNSPPLKERTKAGMAAAAAAGRHAGRPTKQTPENVGAVIAKHDAGVSAARIARDPGISRGTVNRIYRSTRGERGGGTR
jgi:putative DNA-invertase from lambdoid prophage Rac